jgi:P4 family phage/plasmid primase-like protien
MLELPTTKTRAAPANDTMAADYCATHSGRLLYERTTKMLWRYELIDEPCVQCGEMERLSKGRRRKKLTCTHRDLDRGYWIPADGHDMRGGILQFLNGKYPDNARLSAGKVEDIFRLLPYFCDEVESFRDTHVAFTDCLLDTTGFTVAAHSPEIMASIFVRHPYAGLEGAECPMFRSFLDDVCVDSDGKPSPAMQEQLQEIAGYLLTPVKREVCFVLYGTGANGKSVYMDILREMLGPGRCHAATISQLTTQNFEVPGLVGKIANIVDEDESVDGNLATMKRLVSNNPITTRRPYGETFTAELNVKFVFGSNTLPRFKGFDEAIRRRFVCIPFLKKIPLEKRIFELAKKMIAAGEMPGVMAWALSGLRRLKDNGFLFTETDESRAAVEELENASSSVMEFVKEFYVPCDSGRVDAGELYDAYSEWCDGNGREPVNSHRFGREAAMKLGKSRTTTKKVNGMMRGIRYYSAKKKEAQVEPCVFDLT